VTGHKPQGSLVQRSFGILSPIIHQKAICHLTMAGSDTRSQSRNADNQIEPNEGLQPLFEEKTRETTQDKREKKKGDFKQKD
jgi:hypothetical protein